MKKIYLFAIGLFVAGGINAQTMNENFDSYAAGTYMGVASPGWTTWSGTTGGAEDVQVTNANANSGANSIYFSTSSANGGPQDVVVPFGGEHNTGQFYFESMFYVESGNGAYFNFQADNTIGQTWSLSVYMINDGNMYVTGGTGMMWQTTFPFDTWFSLALDINLNLNQWELIVDGNSEGIAQNTVNQVASIDIFPVNPTDFGGNNNASYYMDDFQFNHTPYTLPATNGAVITADMPDPGIVGLDVYPSVQVRNLGTNNITSFDLVIDYDGNQYTENVTGVNIASLAYYDVQFTSPVPFVAGANNMDITISNVNAAGADGDPSDDTYSTLIDPVVPATGKVVLGEEATGTWCQWCPRGAVYMDMMANYYDGFWAGVAIHNGDPMEHTAYDDGFAALHGGSYPSAIVDRTAVIDPSEVEVDFYNQITIAPSAFISNTATYNATTGELTVTVTADFQTAISGNWRLACAITEDGVTGTGAGYAQSNAYAGGSNGEMGGYELLPNPVPASQMVYNHVARDIQPGYNGLVNSFPSSVAAGEVHSQVFTFTIDPTWDLGNMHVVSFLINPSGDVDNAGTATMTELVAIEEESLSNTNPISIYPNPASDMVTVSIGDAANQNVSVEIYDMNGKLVGNKDYGQLSGEMLLPVNVSTLETGIYSIRVTIGEAVQVEKLIVE